MSRITAFIGAAALSMAMMAFAPMAMALDDLPPEVCFLDLSQPIDLDHAPMAAAPSCMGTEVADLRLDPVSTGGDLGEAAPALCVTFPQEALDFAGYRQHEDPAAVWSSQLDRIRSGAVALGPFAQFVQEMNSFYLAGAVFV